MLSTRCTEAVVVNLAKTSRIGCEPNGTSRTGYEPNRISRTAPSRAGDLYTAAAIEESTSTTAHAHTEALEGYPWTA